MTDRSRVTERTVALRGASGDRIVEVSILAAGIALAAALAIAPRLSAIAAVGALAARMSISIENPGSPATES